MSQILVFWLLKNTESCLSFAVPVGFLNLLLLLFVRTWLRCSSYSIYLKCNWIVFKISTRLCSHHNNWLLNIFLSWKRNLVLIYLPTTILNSHSHGPGQQLIAFCLYRFDYSGHWYRCNHSVWGPLWGFFHLA